MKKSKFDLPVKNRFRLFASLALAISFECGETFLNEIRFLNEIGFASPEFRNRANRFSLSKCAFAAPSPSKDQELFDEYRRTYPKSALIAKYGQALQALDHGKRKTAVKLFTELSQQEPKWAGFWTSLGTCCLWNEEFEKGLEYATKAIALRPKDPDMYHRRATMYAALMKNAEAVTDLSKGLTCDPNDLDLLRRRADCYKALRKYPEAITDINRILKIAPGDEKAYFTKAGICEETKDWKAAAAAYTELLTKYPEDDHALIKRAACKMKSNDYKGAIADYTDALRHGTEGPEYVYTQRAIAYEKLGMKEKADKDRAAAQQRGRL